MFADFKNIYSEGKKMKTGNFNFGQFMKNKSKSAYVKPPKTSIRIFINIAVTLIVAAIAYYIAYPSLNIQSASLYYFIGFICVVYGVMSFITSGAFTKPMYLPYAARSLKIPGIIIAVLIVVGIIGSVGSAVFFNAKSYRDLLKISDGNFTQDVDEISFNQVPMLDEASAKKLGDRKLGELSDMVSQFEVANDYTQINYKGRPVRVTPLLYGDVIKWFTNKSEGIPAYLIIDMYSSKVDVVRLKSGMKYSNSELFNRKITRYVQFRYPTKIFETPTFEIDDSGTPYWICSTIVKRIGLFGGMDIDGAILVNAVTGECKEYKISQIPQWVDRVNKADLINQQYNYHGRYINGFWNSIFGQKGVTSVTEGYNYLALKDDVYMYTGITSVTSDQSNIGFILVNQRTKDAKFYKIPGAQENSAMKSAEGAVQDLGYSSTFPLLLNISKQPTYFMALKDKDELVKLYAMVNVQQYQIVATGSTPEQCEAAYIKLLSDKNIIQAEKVKKYAVTGKITDIRTAVKSGNSYYYIKLNTGSDYYSLSASNDEQVVTLNVGDTVTINFGTKANGIYLSYGITRETKPTASAAVPTASK